MRTILIDLDNELLNIDGFQVIGVPTVVALSYSDGWKREVLINKDKIKDKGGKMARVTVEVEVEGLRDFVEEKRGWLASRISGIYDKAEK